MKSKLNFSIERILSKDCVSKTKHNEVLKSLKVQFNERKSNDKGKKRIVLWKFLLELLSNNTEFSDIIRWEGPYGCFTFIKPEVVAAKWGTKKMRNNMTFEKMSRCLRYYYASGILKKVQGRKFAYQFHHSLITF